MLSWLVQQGLESEIICYIRSPTPAPQDLFYAILNQAADPPSNFQADTVILDGAVIVQMLPVKTARTFDEYFNVFLPHMYFISWRQQTELTLCLMSTERIV